MLSLLHQIQLAAQPHKGLLQLSVIRGTGPHPGHHHQVHPPHQLVLVEAVDLPQAAAQPIAHHSMSHLGGHREAQPIAGPSVAPHVDGQAAVCGGAALAVETAEDVVFL